MALAFIVGRLIYGLLSLLILSAIIFICTHLLPGDAAATILGEQATPEALAALRTRLGLDRPFIVQFMVWLAGMPQGDFGISATLNQPVGALIADHFANSFALAVAALIVAASVAIPLGVVAAVRRGSRLDGAILGASYFGISIPDFVVVPVISLSFVLTAHLLRQTRSGMLDVLGSDYIRTARLKGLPERTVLWRH